jgi:GT2 family glycosyltransferase
MKATVLMAVHNGEPYVRETVRSVLDQTFDDFEFVVVDDASTDGTARTVEEFGDDRIRLLRNEHNLGQVPSLNRGLRESRGEYVARIDADDACLPTRLARQVDVLDSEPRVGLVGTWMQAVDEEGRPLARLEKRLEDYVDLVYHTLIMRVYVSHPASMYRREPVLALGGYDETTGPSEDKDLWRKLVLQRWEARIVPEILVHYRLHDHQLSQTRAEYQRRIDGESQDRFLGQLAPDAPVTPVRMLLAGDAEAWCEDAAAMLRGVERVLAGARERLALGDDEARRLDTLVAGRLLDVALASPWHPSARAVATYAVAHLPTEHRSRARRRRARALVTAPMRASGQRALRRAVDLPGLASLRARARRSRLARRLYGRAIGSE